jgi:ribonuclease HI
MIRHVPRSAQRLILDLYNRIWSEGKLVNSWKEALVIPIPKPEAPKSEPQSYRPIALTAVLCKLYERIVVNRLEWYLETMQLINPMQSGFRKQRSTTDHIMRLQDDVHKALNNGEHTLAVFLDFSKAFDMVWKAGLLHKLRQMGIGGQIYCWIADFLTGRKIRVRVGAAISDSYEMVNGTPQGSIISPLLFNLMINDLPTPPLGMSIRPSIFADDSAAWKSSKNLALLCRHVQQHLDKVIEWTSRWGFKLSEKKSVAVLFTKARNGVELAKQVVLEICGVAVKVEPQVKFLGVTYDQRLTWKPHINNVVDKTKKAFNLMRSVSGQSWGASRMALLTIYKALIRSRLDYGCEAFYTASDYELQRLDKIQSKCLRLSCGAMCSTAINALQQECGEMPLALRRKRLLLRFAGKVRANPQNPAGDVTVYNWRADARSYQPGKETVYAILQQYEAGTGRAHLAPRPLEAPPWHMCPPRTDLSLNQRISKKLTPAAVMKSEALGVLAKYTETVRIFTDASKLTGAGVAAAFYVQDIEFGESRRMEDSTSIYAAELAAIQMAVDWLIHQQQQQQQQQLHEEMQQQEQMQQQQQKTSAAIFTDSMSIVTSLAEQRSASNPTALARLLVSIDQLDPPPTFVWIPSHVGVKGNEIADQLAKSAATSHEVELQVPAEIKDEYSRIETFILDEWQALYNSSISGANYRMLEPTVSSKGKLVEKNRKKETVISRLRLGKCRLNAYLHEIHRHPDGLCELCQEAETIEHLLLRCKTNDFAEKLQSACAALSPPVPPSLTNILSSPKLADLVFDLVRDLKRTL